MHRLFFALAILLLSNRVEAAPFTPTEWSFAITGATFDETGTDAICWRCADADPNNDVQAVISAGGFGGGFWTPLGNWPAGILNLDFSNSTATEVIGLDFPFSVHITVMMTDGLFASIESSDLFARVRQVYSDDTLVVEACCGGDFQGVGFSLVYPPSPFQFGPDVAGSFGIEVRTFGGQVISNTPEPTSLLLLGSGLAAAALRRRREWKSKGDTGWRW
jgi:hypothetical protein